MRLPNFNAGPAAMPDAVLETIQHDLLDFQGHGLSVLEMSHRSDVFAEIALQAKQDLIDLLEIPKNYDVLFMQGGATAQFSLSVNNLDINKHIGVANTGHWSRLAINAADLATQVSSVTEPVSDPLLGIAEPSSWNIPNDISYLHITDNETISGVTISDAHMQELASLDVPLICDMSSSILSRPIDVSQYALIYAGAQKNIGPSGITVLIVRHDMLERSRTMTTMPRVFNYAAIADSGSMLNTPPTFAWYASGLVFKWLKESGGLAAQWERNQAQAAKVYSAVDRLEAYTNKVAPAFRSIMNVSFELDSDAVTHRFLEQASAAGLIGLKGHKSIGGVRASLYNAMKDESVDRLLLHMNEFAKKEIHE